MNVSLAFGLLLAGLAGWMVLNKLKFQKNDFEKAAYSMLLGLGIQSVWMFLMDVIGFQFSQSILTVMNLVLIIALSDIEKLKQLNLNKLLDTFKNSLVVTIKNFNAGSAVVWLVIGGLFYLISIKSLFWPTTEHDAIGTFDKLGIWYAIEGKIHVSLYDFKLQGAGGVYPPLFHCSIAYVYLYGAENPKILSLIYYLSCIVIFYSISKRYVSNFGAAVFTLILAWAPEFFSHAALLLSNLPATAYVAMATLPMFVWLKEKDSFYLNVSLVGIGFALWLRQDLVAFAAAGWLIVFVHFLTSKEWKTLLWYSFAVLVPLVVWTIYVNHYLALSATNRLVFSNLFNFQKIQLLSKYLWAYLGIGQAGSSPPGYFLYGIAFLIPLIPVVLSFKTIMKEWWFVITYTAISLLFYAAIFMLIDEKIQEANLQSLLESSFKRGLFCFMPMALFQAVIAEKTKLFFNSIDNYLWSE